MALRGISGDPTQNEIYQAVGCALSDWEAMEIELAILFSVFRFGMVKWHVVERFGHFASVSTGRLQLVQRAAAKFFMLHCSQPNEGDFKILMERVHASKQDRHRIAHGIVVRVTLNTEFSGPKFQTEFDNLGPLYALCAPVYAIRSLSKIPNGPFGYHWLGADIRKHGENFQQLAGEIREYTKRVAPLGVAAI